jgi:hypothetical protein
MLLVSGILVIAGCHPVSQEVWSAHQTDYNTLKTQFNSLVDKLQAWAGPPTEPAEGAAADNVFDWMDLTVGVICDIVAKNPASYASETVAFCKTGTEGNGSPPPPPDFP